MKDNRFERKKKLYFDFRHAKKVYEQNTREKILSGEKQAVATVSVSPLVSTAVIPKQSIHHSYLYCVAITLE